MSKKIDTQAKPEGTAEAKQLPDLAVQSQDAAAVRGGGIVMEYARGPRPAEPPDT